MHNNYFSRARIAHDALQIFSDLFHQFGLGDWNAHYLVVANGIDKINIADNFYKLTVVNLRNKHFFIAF